MKRRFSRTPSRMRGAMIAGSAGSRRGGDRHRWLGERPAKALLAVAPRGRQAGRHHARAEHGDADALGGQFLAQHEAVADDGVLAGGVDAVRVVARDHAVERGGVDDVRLATPVALTLLADPRQERADAVQLAPEVHREHPLPVLLAHLRQRAVHRHPGVVEQQVDLAELLVRALRERLDGVPLGHVGFDGEAAHAARGDLLRPSATRGSRRCPRPRRARRRPRARGRSRARCPRLRR